MTSFNDLNKNLVTRLVKYKRVLRKLKGLGFVKVFSNNLADAIGVTAAVVRKDFSMIGVPGNKRGGYTIDTLTADLSLVLGSRERKSVILVGCGRIGRALMNYGEFAKEDMHIIAGFDLVSDPNGVNGIPIFSLDQLSDFVKSQNIEVGILAVPENAATTTFEAMINAGIRGILNFTTVELKCSMKCDRATCPRHCTVSNVNIGLELENLFYLITMNSRPQALAEVVPITSRRQTIG
jgi:redox-sensing transcriptional repressor